MPQLFCQSRGESVKGRNETFLKKIFDKFAALGKPRQLWLYKLRCGQPITVLRAFIELFFQTQRTAI